MLIWNTWRPLAAAVLILFGAPTVAFATDLVGTQADSVEQLDEVKVTAARIAPLPRSLPVPGPEISTASPLPPDGHRPRFTPIPPAGLESPPRRVLLDDTALTQANRTRVRYLETVRPAYPRRARELGWAGVVWLRLEVRADGTVGEATVQRSSGHALLDRAALGAARGWSFAPQMDGTFALTTMVDVPVRFDLTDQREDPGFR